MQPLISIIIPTFNRAHLLGETLDSVLAQTSENWECIVVDDGSKDYTDELVEFYCLKDLRILYFHRPTFKIKGANSCRNYGFERSKGKYIQWFDSDDLMEIDCLETKLNKIIEEKSDFVVAKLENFLPDGTIVQPVYNREHKINLEDFLFRRINWITHDPLISREVIDIYKIRFNEEMSSDQEYNYYSKLLSKTTKGIYINKVLALRRIHPSSIQSNIDRSSRKYFKELFKNRLLTFCDIHNNLSIITKNDYLDQIMTIYFTALGKRVIPKPQRLFGVILKVKGIRSSFFFTLSLISNYFLRKGFYLLQKAKNKNSLK